MIYNWNIDEWGKQEIYEEWRKEPYPSWVKSLLKPVKVVYNLLMAHRIYTLRKMRYNSQGMVLQNMLNDMFDAELRRIKVITTYDILESVYLYQSAENEPLFVNTADENKPVYLYQFTELGVQYDFIVEAAFGSLTAEKIIQIKSLVSYYKLAGKKPYYRYDNLQPF